MQSINIDKQNGIMRIKTLDEFTNHINEAKGDNLHQFVQYMNEA